MGYPGEYRKYGIQASTGNVGPSEYWEGRNPGEYRKYGIRASTENGESGQVLGKVGSKRVPKMWDPGEYREGRNSGEYRQWGI